LNVYNYSAADLASLNFQLKLASAVEQGTVKPAENKAAVELPFTSAGEIGKITADLIDAKNYNNVAYNIFKEWTTRSDGTTGPAYKYTYIRGVTLSIPSTETAYYTIVNAAGTTIATPVDPTDPALLPAGSDPKLALSYIGIKPNNLTNTVDTKIKITIKDVFGFTKEVELPIKLIKQF